MPKYRLTARFEIKDHEGFETKEDYDEIVEVKSIQAAEKYLDDVTSKMISVYSDQSWEWVITEKCVSEIGDAHEPGTDILKDTIHLFL